MENRSKSPEEQQDEVVIALMGNTGTGKSSFIQLLTGDKNARVGDTLDSETDDVVKIAFTDPVSGRKVVLVDTPGFDDSRDGRTDTEILRKISEFMLSEYDQHRKLNGAIFFHRMSDPRFGGQSRRALRIFRELCGAATFKNVVVLTTFWDRVNEQEGVAREEELKSNSNFFKDLVDGGARFMRHSRENSAARQVLDHIFTLSPTNVQIQQEIRVEGKSLEETAAGAAQREEINRMIAKHKKEMEDLNAEIATVKKGNEALKRELDEERAELRKKLLKWEDEKVDLKKGLDNESDLRKRLEDEIALQRETYEKAQQELRAELEKSKKEQNEALMMEVKRKAREAERAKRDAENALERRMSFKEMGQEIARGMPLVPTALAKPVFGTIGRGLDIFDRRKRSTK
ncbi:P-loop containing nucleoside triphosphate hydrolase protein [Lentinula raphanica]|uniref:P-loop containing nucleoside triphosphate hydrolase protein n=1 Tax=Lentinula raphanica TaxID=153919 RepID=A0AA38UJ43_9AGAR|nr:P-loop containing nucleoside triphosphate hydrolase protein [Lentinula raphanica]KAJ3971164.1 P-loop containing nucleoside triphosphate hydrolase protein [Lentinula raphanica]